MPFVHENDLTGSASHYMNLKRGVPAANPEMGGSYLGPENTALYTKQAIAGILAMVSKPPLLKPLRAPLFTTTTCGFSDQISAGAPDWPFEKP